MKNIRLLFLVVALLLSVSVTTPVLADRHTEWVSFKSSVVVLGFQETPKIQARYHLDGKWVTMFLSVRGKSNAPYLEVVLPFRAIGEKTVTLRHVFNGSVFSGNAGRGLIIENILYASPDLQGLVLWAPSLNKGFDVLFSYEFKN